MIVKAFKDEKEIELKLVSTRGYRGFNTKLECVCDICNKKFLTSYKLLVRTKSEDKQSCQSCKTKITCLQKFGSTSAPLSLHFINKIKTRRKTNFEEIKEKIELEGYKLLSPESDYENRKSPLRVLCPKGHEFTSSRGKWLCGYRCVKCQRIKVANKLRTNINVIREALQKEGYSLISTNYKKNNQKLSVRCPKNHEYRVSWSQWKNSKSRCPICFHKRVGEKQKLTYDFVKKAFEEKGYTLLSKTYKGAAFKLKFICPNNHRSSISWLNFQQGHGCGVCSGKQKLTFSDVKSFIEMEGYTLVSKEFVNSKHKLVLVCPKGHCYSVKFNDFQQGHRCPLCGNTVSKAEQEIANFLKPYFSDLIQSDRQIIKPLELDIVIPSKKVAIEFCGLYWHSDKVKRDKNYHLNKLDLCNKAGYDLITIFEDEWVFKKEIVKSRLKVILRVAEAKKIYARKCSIREIDPASKNNFLEDFHIQGKDSSSIKLGAFYKDKLVSVMTFSKGNISKGSLPKDKIYELNRFCSDSDYSIVGIASKLLKYFIKHFNCNQIFSYSDRRWSTGKLYQTIGFDFVHNSCPNYWYIKQLKRMHRFNFRKSVLKNKLSNFDCKLTEITNMANNGYKRIFDCGNSKWIYDN